MKFKYKVQEEWKELESDLMVMCYKEERDEGPTIVSFCNGRADYEDVCWILCHAMNALLNGLQEDEITEVLAESTMRFIQSYHDKSSTMVSGSKSILRKLREEGDEE